MKRPWKSQADWLMERYGERVYKVSVDAGLSCPNRKSDGSGGCSFCDGTGAVAVHLRPQERGLSSASSILLSNNDIESQIEKGLCYIRYRYKSGKAILYFQSWSNTNASLEKLKELYDRALAMHPFVSLTVSTRPDLVPDEVCDLLASYITAERDVWVELGLQSANDETLRRIGRGHDVASYVSAVSRLKTRGIRVCTHMMILPFCEKLEDSINTVRLINEVGSDAVKIHSLTLCRGTRLLDEYLSDGCYPMISLQRLVETDATLLAHLDEKVIVERLVSEMTAARAVNPLHFPDKREILDMIASYMNERGWTQGCMVNS